MKDRLHTIDILRGIIIILMIIAHVFKYWLLPSGYWLLGYYFLIVDPIGTAGFTYVSGMAFGYSWQKEKESGKQIKERYLKNLSRTLALLGFSFIYNIIALIAQWSTSAGWIDIWTWYILQTIAICRLISLGIIHFPRIIRVLIAVIVIIITPFILTELNLIRTTNLFASIVYHLLFNPVHLNGILFYLPYFIIGTIMGEFLFDIFEKKTRSPTLLYWWVIPGVLCICLGIILGSQLVVEDFGYNVLDFLNTHPTIHLTGIPLFLITNSYPFIIYAIGIQLLITVFFVLFADIKRKNKSTRSEKKGDQRWMIEYYGQYSLTIYFVHYLFIIFPLKLSVVFIWVGLIIVALILGIIVWILDRYTGGIYSVERAVVILADVLYRNWIQKSPNFRKEQGTQTLIKQE